jgi:glycine cleavage system H protein
MQPCVVGHAASRRANGGRSAVLVVSFFSDAGPGRYGAGVAAMKLETVAYKRSRFSTRLPLRYRYVPSHYWLYESQPGVWQVGFTKFATRMLGDLVEFDFKAPVGASIEPGQVIGWTEGFKAMSDIYSAVSGEFLGANPALAAAITLIDHDPYGEGWLYRARGQPDDHNTDVNGYIAVLDATIDTMLRSRHDQ